MAKKDYSDEFKIRVVAEYIDGNEAGAEVARRHKISTASVWTWARDPRYNPKLKKNGKGNGHIVAPLPTRPMRARPRRPKRRLPLIDRVEEIESAIEELRGELGMEA